VSGNIRTQFAKEAKEHVEEVWAEHYDWMKETDNEYDSDFPLGYELGWKDAKAVLDRVIESTMEEYRQFSRSLRND
jgi:hypothetical protein